jgi:hypothetical protein
VSALALREALIEQAEEYARNDEPLPADLISDLMVNGIDHTQFTTVATEQQENGEIHNVD